MKEAHNKPNRHDTIKNYINNFDRKKVERNQFSALLALIHSQNLNTSNGRTIFNIMHAWFSYWILTNIGSYSLREKNSSYSSIFEKDLINSKNAPSTTKRRYGQNNDLNLSTIFERYDDISFNSTANLHKRFTSHRSLKNFSSKNADISPSELSDNKRESSQTNPHPIMQKRVKEKIQQNLREHQARKMIIQQNKLNETKKLLIDFLAKSSVLEVKDLVADRVYKRLMREQK